MENENETYISSTSAFWLCAAQRIYSKTGHETCVVPCVDFFACVSAVYSHFLLFNGKIYFLPLCLPLGFTSPFSHGSGGGGDEGKAALSERCGATIRKKGVVRREM